MLVGRYKQTYRKKYDFTLNILETNNYTQLNGNCNDKNSSVQMKSVKICVMFKGIWVRCTINSCNSCPKFLYSFEFYLKLSKTFCN